MASSKELRKALHLACPSSRSQESLKTFRRCLKLQYFSIAHIALLLTQTEIKTAVFVIASVRDFSNLYACHFFELICHICAARQGHFAAKCSSHLQAANLEKP